MLIRLFNPNDLIVCGRDFNQSGSVGLCRSTWVYMGNFFKGWWGKKSAFYLNWVVQPQ